MMTGNPTRTRRKGLQFGILFRAVLALFLAACTGRLALYLAPWQPPVKYASLVALLLAFALIVYGVKWAWQWLRTVSLGRVLVFVLLCYCLVVFIVGLRAWGEAGLLSHWLDVAIGVPMDAGRAVSRGAVALVQFPGRYWTEFSGPFVADTAGTGVAPTGTPVPANALVAPIRIVTTPAETNATVLSLGDPATTTDRAGRLCQMDAFAEGPFAAGTKVRLVEGPHYITDEVWWRVRSEVSSGWCPGRALLP